MNIHNTHTSSHERSTYSQNENNCTYFPPFFAHQIHKHTTRCLKQTEVSMGVSHQTQVACLGAWLSNKLTWSSSLSVLCQSRNRDKRLVGERSEKLPRQWATKHMLYLCVRKLFRHKLTQPTFTSICWTCRHAHKLHVKQRKQKLPGGWGRKNCRIFWEMITR